jgi:hypothetical protein
LYQFLGINPKNAKRVVSSDRQLEDEALSRRSVESAIKFSLCLDSWWDVFQPLQPGADYRLFLHRILLASDDPCRGTVKATKKFVKFVKEVWLQGVYPERKIFSPEQFFKLQGEIDLYRKHVASLPRKGS